MTTITFDNHHRVGPYASRSFGSSLSSKMVYNALAESNSDASPEASSLPARAFAELARVARDCERGGWDGHDAKSINQLTCDRARAFLTDLPVWMPAPDIVPETDGQIAIEWYIAPERTFSISVGEDGPLHYAGLFDDEDEVHGVKAFDGVSVPENILQYICKLLGSAATGRAA